MGNKNKIGNELEQAEIFLRAIDYFNGYSYTRLFYHNRLSHRFPNYIWNGEKLIERNIQETQGNPARG